MDTSTGMVALNPSSSSLGFSSDKWRFGGTCLHCNPIAAFITPIGFQTNLMILSPGGYRFGDFGILGGALTITAALVVTGVTFALPASILD